MNFSVPPALGRVKTDRIWCETSNLNSTVSDGKKILGANWILLVDYSYSVGQRYIVVDDFRVQHTDRKDVEHLIGSLLPHYQLTTDWEGKIYCGLHLKWDYEACTVELSMPGYIGVIILQKFLNTKVANVRLIQTVSKSGAAVKAVAGTNNHLMVAW